MQSGEGEETVTGAKDEDSAADSNETYAQHQDPSDVNVAAELMACMKSFNNDVWKDWKWRDTT